MIKIGAELLKLSQK